MKAKSFDYRKIPNHQLPKKRWIKRPMLQVTLTNGSKRQQVLCLVDSGADECLFHVSIAYRLGISDVSAGIFRRFDGIAESVNAYMHPVQLQIQSFPESVEIYAGFTEADGVWAILGQAGFFANYKVTFERYRGRLEVVKRPEPIDDERR
jgi:hypothetical protein